jgi:hypothetical protein
MKEKGGINLYIYLECTTTYDIPPRTDWTWKHANLIEMKELQSNPDELNKYIQSLDPTDAAQLVAKYRKMNQAGMLGK